MNVSLGNRLRAALGVVLTGAVVAVTGGVTLLVLAFSLLGCDRTSNRKWDWPNYNRETVSRYFKLPEETQVLSAVHTDTAIMGERFVVRFRLPDTRTPEEWLRVIATESRFPRTYHKSRFVYDCGGNCDLTRLEYHPADGVYEACGGWD